MSCLDDPLHDYVRIMIASDSADKARKLFDYSIKRANSEIRTLMSQG